MIVAVAVWGLQCDGVEVMAEAMGLCWCVGGDVVMAVSW